MLGFSGVQKNKLQWQFFFFFFHSRNFFAVYNFSGNQRDLKL